MADELSIHDLHYDERNARRHTPKNLQMIEDSINELGMGRSILIDEENNIIAGNGTVESAILAGKIKVKVVEATGEEIVAVRRTNLSEEQKVRMALFDNASTDSSEWDVEVLRDLKGDGFDLSGIFHDDDLKNLHVVGADGKTFDGRVKDALTASTEPPPPDEAPAEFPEVDDDIDTDYRCPNCEYEWSGKPK
jgi:hypothetical protein